MVVVSHDTKTVQELCDRGIVIQKGVKIFDGPVAEAVEVLKG